MNKELTPEQAKKLLNAIFAETEEMTAEDETELADDNYPETVTDKVGYAEYVITHSLEYIGKTLHRLNRLHRLLSVSTDAQPLPDIITHNELRMALEPLLHVENDIKDIAEMLTDVYRATKPPEAKGE